MALPFWCFQYSLLIKSCHISCYIHFQKVEICFHFFVIVPNFRNGESKRKPHNNACLRCYAVFRYFLVVTSLPNRYSPVSRKNGRGLINLPRNLRPRRRGMISLPNRYSSVSRKNGRGLINLSRNLRPRWRGGGKRGIRTLERVLAVTRFPIVRLRPAQPSFHIYLTMILYHILRKMSSTFLKKYVKPCCATIDIGQGSKKILRDRQKSGKIKLLDKIHRKGAYPSWTL